MYVGTVVPDIKHIKLCRWPWGPKWPPIQRTSRVSSPTGMPWSKHGNVEVLEKVKVLRIEVLYQHDFMYLYFSMYIYDYICVHMYVIYVFCLYPDLYLYIQYDYRISCHLCSIKRVLFCDGAVHSFIPIATYHPLQQKSPQSRHQTSTKELLKLSNSELTVKCLKRPCFENYHYFSANADQLDELELFDHKVAGLVCFLSGTWKLDSRFQVPSTFYSFVFAGLVRFR